MYLLSSIFTASTFAAKPTKDDSGNVISHCERIVQKHDGDVNRAVAQALAIGVSNRIVGDGHAKEIILAHAIIGRTPPEIGDYLLLAIEMVEFKWISGEPMNRTVHVLVNVKTGETWASSENLIRNNGALSSALSHEVVPQLVTQQALALTEASKLISTPVIRKHLTFDIGPRTLVFLEIGEGAQPNPSLWSPGPVATYFGWLPLRALSSAGRCTA